MKKVEKISVFQLMSLIIINRFLFGFSFMPTVTIAPANQDAWMTDLLSGVIIFLFAIPLLIMSSQFPKRTFNEYFQLILGKPVGKVISVIYAIYLVGISSLTVLLLSDFLLSAVMPETPPYAILIFILVPCCYATYKGLECIVRAATLMAIVIAIIIGLYFFLNYNNMHFDHFLPILSDTSLSEMAFSSFNNASRFSDCFLFFLFLPYIGKTKSYTPTKILLIAVTVFTLMNTILTVATQAVLGAGFSKTLKYPYFTSIQQINVYDIIQRVEFFNVMAWIIIFFFKLASTNLAASMIMAQVFKTKSYKPFVIPINLVITGLVLFTSISYYAVLKKVFDDIAYLIIFTVNFAIPSVVLLVYYIRRKSLRNKT